MHSSDMQTSTTVDCRGRTDLESGEPPRNGKAYSYLSSNFIRTPSPLELAVTVRHTLYRITLEGGQCKSMNTACKIQESRKTKVETPWSGSPKGLFTR